MYIKIKCKLKIIICCICTLTDCDNTRLEISILMNQPTNYNVACLHSHYATKTFYNRCS